MTRRRAPQAAPPDAPITGVAGGSLGTAANLDDTQVFSTAELLAAAPEAAPVAAPEPGAAQPVRPTVQERRRGRQSLPAMAGLVVVLVLALVAGAGILSTLDFGAADAPALAQPSSDAPRTAPPETPKPEGKEGKEGKGHGGCHGNGHGCSGGNED